MAAKCLRKLKRVDLAAQVYLTIGRQREAARTLVDVVCHGCRLACVVTAQCFNVAGATKGSADL